MKKLALTTPGDLSETLLANAIELALPEGHDGYADLVVHPSQLRPAMKLAAEQNKAKGLQIRVLAEERVGVYGWKLKTRNAEVVGS